MLHLTWGCSFYNTVYYIITLPSCLSFSCFLGPLDLCCASTSIFASVITFSISILSFQCVPSFRFSLISLSGLLASFLAPENSYIYMSSSPQSAKCVKPSLEINGPWAMPNKNLHSLGRAVGRLLTEELTQSFTKWIDGKEVCMCISFS